MLSAEDNDLLCRVEGAAPMGQIARPAMPVSLLEGASDTAVLQFRRIMLEAMRDFQATGPVIGRGEPFIPHAKLRSFGGVVPMTAGSAHAGVTPQEPALAPISNRPRNRAGLRSLSRSATTTGCGHWSMAALQIDGVDPVFMLLEPEEIFFRAFRHADFDICELSMSSFTVKTANGDCPYVGVPVFPSRAFRHNSIYVRTDHGIAARGPEGQACRRAGISGHRQCLDARCSGRRARR